MLRSMFVAGFLFVLGGVAALAVLAFLFLTDIGRAILALVALLLMLAVLAGIAFLGWPMLQGILRDDGVREVMQWLGGAILVGMGMWAIWIEVSGRVEARRRGISYAALIAEKYPNVPKYSPPRPWGPKLPR